MEEIINLAGSLGTDAGHLGEIGERCALDRFEGSEMVQQRPLARGAYTGDFLQAGLADVAPTALPVGADRETVRFVAQSLNKVEHGITRLELERFASRREECLEAGIPLRPLGDGHQRNIADAQGCEGSL